MSEENKSNLTTTVAVVLIAMFAETVVWNGGWVTSIGPSNTNNTEGTGSGCPQPLRPEPSWLQSLLKLIVTGLLRRFMTSTVIADPTNLPSDEELDITEVTTAGQLIAGFDAAGIPVRSPGRHGFKDAKKS